MKELKEKIKQILIDYCCGGAGITGLTTDYYINQIKKLLDQSYTAGLKQGKSVASFNSEIARVEKEAFAAGRKAMIKELEKRVIKGIKYHKLLS